METYIKTIDALSLFRRVYSHWLASAMYVVLNLYSLRIVYNAQHFMLSVYSVEYILHIIHNEQNSYTLYIMSNTVKLLIVYNAHRVSKSIKLTLIQIL